MVERSRQAFLIKRRRNAWGMLNAQVDAARYAIQCEGGK